MNGRILNRLTDSRGCVRFWQRGGGYDRNIVTDHKLVEKIHYIHNNPVQRGLVDQPTDWKWSSARFYEGLGGIGPEGPGSEGPVTDPVVIA